MPERDFKNIAEQIGITVLIYRLRTGLSQFALGIEVQLSTNQIGRIERGETNPTVFSLSKIAKALNVDISEFFIERSDKEQKKILNEITILQVKANKK